MEKTVKCIGHVTILRSNVILLYRGALFVYRVNFLNSEQCSQVVIAGFYGRLVHSGVRFQPSHTKGVPALNLTPIGIGFLYRIEFSLLFPFTTDKAFHWLSIGQYLSFKYQRVLWLPTEKFILSLSFYSLKLTYSFLFDCTGGQFNWNFQ